MARTLGVELSPARCALVELTRRGNRVRLKRFATIDAGSDEPERLAGELRRLRRERGLPKRVRAVVWSAASVVPTVAGDYRDRIEPLRAAGFSLEATASPLEALSTLDSILKRDAHRPAAYIAVNSDGAALAVVRAGELLIGQEFDWSALEDPHKADRSALGRRLGAAIQHVLLDAGTGSAEFDRITLCGSLPQLRALIVPLGGAFGRPVETLDTIEGVDTEGLDVPILELQKDLAGLRLAWAMASGPVSRAAAGRSAAAAWLRPIAAAGLLTAAVAATVLACWPRDEWTQSVTHQPLPPPVPVSAVGSSEAPRTLVPQPAPAPPAADARRAAEAPVPQLPPAPPAPPQPRPALPVTPSPPAGPPQWKLRSILVSNDRRLAIIDGRIVGPGDRIGRDRVIEIEEREVVFADAAGRVGRVHLWPATHGVSVR